MLFTNENSIHGSWVLQGSVLRLGLEAVLRVLNLDRNNKFVHKISAAVPKPLVCKLSKSHASHDKRTEKEIQKVKTDSLG